MNYIRRMTLTNERTKLEKIQKCWMHQQYCWMQLATPLYQTGIVHNVQTSYAIVILTTKFAIFNSKRALNFIFWKYYLHINMISFDKIHNKIMFLLYKKGWKTNYDKNIIWLCILSIKSHFHCVIFFTSSYPTKTYLSWSNNNINTILLC